MRRLPFRLFDPELVGRGGDTLGECLLDTAHASPEEAVARTEGTARGLARMRAHTGRLLASLTPAERAAVAARFEGDAQGAALLRALTPRGRT